jgi:hypothetical protein
MTISSRLNGKEIGQWDTRTLRKGIISTIEITGNVITYEVVEE